MYSHFIVKTASLGDFFHVLISDSLRENTEIYLHVEFYKFSEILVLTILQHLYFCS